MSPHLGAPEGRKSSHTPPARRRENTQHTPILHYIRSLFIYSPLWLPQVRYLSPDFVFFFLSFLVFRGAKEQGGTSSNKFLRKLRSRLTTLTSCRPRGPVLEHLHLIELAGGQRLDGGVRRGGVAKENTGRGVAAVQGVKRGGMVSLQWRHVSRKQPLIWRLPFFFVFFPCNQ